MKELFYKPLKRFDYRKRLNNGPPFFHSCISYINREHACKKGGPLFKRLRKVLLLICLN